MMDDVDRISLEKSGVDDDVDGGAVCFSDILTLYLWIDVFS